jgi:hypothetical protein
MEAKRDIFCRYAEWKANGSRRDESPIGDLREEYQCNENYPRELYNKCLEAGTVESQWAGGRPTEFDEAFFDKHMVPLIREARSRQRVASSRSIATSIKKQRKKKGAPSSTTVHRAKQSLGFKKTKVKKKPKIGKALQDQRLAMARERRGKMTKAQYIQANARKVQGDEKWMSEEKGNVLAFEARDDSPVAANVQFVGKDAETRTQLIKIMFLLCATSTTPIGVYELDFKKWNEANDAKTAAGKQAKGITGAFLLPILKKVAKDARKKLGAGPISFLHDKAPPYQWVMKQGDDCGFDGGIEMAAGKAPDMSFLDAGLCKFMEGEVERAGATTADEIRAAVKAAWKKVKPEDCEKIAGRVYDNMGEVMRLKGGNFYHEKK